MIKAKYIAYRDTVLIAWTGKDSFGIGKKVKGKYVAKYSTKVLRTLVKKDVKFVNKFSDVYHFPGHYNKPRDCQKGMLDFLIRHHRKYNLSEMRTGKTAPDVWEKLIEHIYNGKKRFIIFAPLSTLEDTWKPELFGIAPWIPVFYSVHKTDSVRKLKRALLKKANSDKPSIFVINFDKIWRVLDELLIYDPDCVTVDEASDFNDRKTNKYKALATLMKDPRRSLTAMTGTAMPNSPPDVWAMARLINPDTPAVWGHLRNMTMKKHPFKPHAWEVKPEAKDIVARLMQPSIRYRTDEVADMPDHSPMSVTTHLSTKQEKMYNEMKRLMITQDDGKTITAQHAGVRLWKLLQIASGVCKDENGNPVLIGAKPKIDEVKRLIREAPKKTVIMSSFTSVQDYIIKELSSTYKVGRINGGVSVKERTKILKSFQEGDMDVLVCHPRPTRYGLKMHAASQMIWFGPVYSALDFEQGSFRIRGPGTGKTTYIKLSACPLEEEIYEVIQKRMDNQEETMDTAESLRNIYASFFE